MARFSTKMRGPEAVALLNQLDTELQALKAGGGGNTGGGTVPVLSAPGGLSASAPTSSSMVVSWNAVAGSYGYNIYRGGVKVNSAVVLTTNFTDSGLAASTQYSWTVKTLNSAGVEGLASAAITAVTSATAANPVAAPLNPVTSAPTATSVVVGWSAVAGAVGYNVYRGAVKINASAVSGLSFTDTGLNAATQYSWTIRALNSVGVEGPASAAVTAMTAAAAGAVVMGIGPMYSDIAEIFFEGYEYPWSYTLNDIDLRFNVVTLFTLQPAGTPAVPNKRDNLGDGTFQFLNAGEPPISNDKIAALRARGVRLHLGVGGADNGFNFDTRTRSTNFLNSFYQIVDSLGGIVDGLCWNTFEMYLRTVYANSPAATTTNTGELVWMSLELKKKYGSNFAITLPPTPAAFPPQNYSPYDLIVTNALNNAGVLSYVAPQYYDTDSVKPANVVSDFHAKWVDAFGASKVVMGLSHGNMAGNFNDCLTTAEANREVDRVLLRDPQTKGFYVWSMHDKINATFPAFLDSMIARFGASPLVPLSGGATPPVVTGESAVTNAMAYGGGQNGAWVDLNAPYLRQLPAAVSNVVTASGQQFGRIMDRSSNGNDVFAPGATPNLGTYDVAAGKTRGLLYGPFESSTGGGSLENPSNGFTLAMSCTPKSYYVSLWNDSTGPNNGRMVYYDSDENGLVFSVGTGTAPRRTVKIVGLGTAFQANTLPRSFKVWHDMAAQTINIQMQGGAVVSQPCPAYAAGGANFAIASADPVTSGASLVDVYQAVHVFSTLTQALRDGLGNFVSGKLP